MIEVFAGIALLAAAVSPATGSTISVVADRTAREKAEGIDLVKDPKTGRAAWEDVLKEAVDTQQPIVVQAAIVNKIADAYYYDQRPADAIGPLEVIEAQLRASGDGNTAVMADTISNLGLMYDAGGNPGRNLEYQKRALDIFEGLKDVEPARVASTSINYATALMNAGLAYEGSPYALHAVELYQAAGLRDATVAIATGSAANIAVTGGRAEVAIPLARQAVEIAHAVLPPDNPYYGFAEATLGKALMMSGRLDEAEPHFRIGLDVLGQAFGERHPMTLTVMQNLGLLLYQSGQLNEAMTLTLAAAAGQAGSKSLASAQSLSAASTYASELGDEDRAINLGRRAYNLLLANPNPTGLAAASITRRYGEIVAAAGRTDLALPVLQRGADLAAASMPDGNGRNAQAEIGLAAAEIDAGHAVDGLARLQRGVVSLKQRMSRYAPMADLNEDAFTYYNDFATAITVAINLGRVDLAIEYYQLATWGFNARTAQEVALRRSVVRQPALALSVRQVQEDARQARLLRRSYTALVARGKTASAADMQIEINRLETRMAAGEVVLVRKVPGYRDNRNPVTISLAKIQQRLTPRDSVLIAMPARYGLLLFAITSDGATVDKLALGRGKIRAMVANLRKSVDDGLVDEGAAFDVGAAYRLHQALFTPKIRAGLRNGGTLHVITSDALATFSLAMLVREKVSEKLTGAKLAAVHWLVRDYAVETPMSLATMTIEQPRGGGRRTFIGIGAPALTGARDAPIQLAAIYRGGAVGRAAISSLPALPHAAQELKQIAAVIAPRHHILLIGRDATEARVRKIDWRGQSVIAFATHGLSAGEIGSAMEPALVLSPNKYDGSLEGSLNGAIGSDGLLTASEILTMKLDSDLVILSACNSASGNSRISAPYTGLANAFLFAGTKSLLISHWPLRDDSAARLSVETVRGMRNGFTEADALRQAQLGLLEDTTFEGASHPATWAGFVLVTR